MTNPSEAYTKALLALSGGGPHLGQTRQSLLSNISDEDFKATFEHCVQNHLSRQQLEGVLCNLLDEIVEGGTRDVDRQVAPSVSLRPRQSALQTPVLSPPGPDTSVRVQLFLRIVCAKFGGRPCWFDSLDKHLELKPLLVDKFRADFLSNSKDIGTYKDMEDDPFMHLNERFCLDKHLNIPGSSQRCTFLQSDNKNGYTCDTCIERGRLCIRPAYVDGNVELVVYPLPKKSRGGSEPTDKRYWVQD